MVVLVAFFQSTKYWNSVYFARFVYHDGLETTFERLVFLEILLIFIECCCTYSTQFASCKGWLQNVGSIHCALSATCSDERVDFVDEENDVAFSVGYLFDDTFQSFLELAFVLRACYQRTHIQRVELLVFQVFWHVATYNTFCQTFYNGSLTRTRFADKYRIVLRSSWKNLQYAAYFLVAAYYWVELSWPSVFNQVTCVLW